MRRLKQIPELATGASSALRSYQREGVAFLVRSQSALLADEMGLGKTVQTAIALGIVLRLKNCNRALVICPAALKLNWERELNRWTPNLVVRQLRGDSRERTALYMLPIQVLIASYEQIRIDASHLDELVHFDVIILDEAQRIKNESSATAFASRLLPRSRAWALTGTPVENKPQDLVSIFGFLKLGLIYAGMSRSEMHTRMRRYFLRRRKKDVLTEIPPMIAQDLPLELQGKQKEAYDNVWLAREAIAHPRRGQGAHANLLALITRLKQLCNFDPISDESVKLDTLKVILESLSKSTDKVIVFSQYVQTLEWLSERLPDIPNNLYHGGQSESKRDAALSSFRSLDGPRVLLVSLKAGGVGLNLQEASVVVLFDRWWNPATEDQAVQRAHRFGRERPLHVFRFLVTNSIEQRIATVLAEKRIIFQEYVELADNAAVKAFSEGELYRILDITPSRSR